MELDPDARTLAARLLEDRESVDLPPLLSQEQAWEAVCTWLNEVSTPQFRQRKRPRPGEKLGLEEVSILESKFPQERAEVIVDRTVPSALSPSKLLRDEDVRMKFFCSFHVGMLHLLTHQLVRSTSSTLSRLHLASALIKEACATENVAYLECLAIMLLTPFEGMSLADRCEKFQLMFPAHKLPHSSNSSKGAVNWRVCGLFPSEEKKPLPEQCYPSSLSQAVVIPQDSAALEEIPQYSDVMDTLTQSMDQNADVRSLVMNELDALWCADLCQFYASFFSQYVTHLVMQTHELFQESSVASSLIFDWRLREMCRVVQHRWAILLTRSIRLQEALMPIIRSLHGLEGASSPVWRPLWDLVENVP